jgi:hypothetical protein
MNLAYAHRRIVVLGLFALLTGCASKHEVKCDGRLEPINPPASKASASPNKETPPQHIESSP